MKQIEGQLDLFDYFTSKPIKELAVVVAEKMNDNSDLNFKEIMNTGYYLLFVAEKNGHRFVIDGTDNKLGFGIDNLFLAHNGYVDVKERYDEWKIGVS